MLKFTFVFIITTMTIFGQYKYPVQMSAEVSNNWFYIAGYYDSLFETNIDYITCEKYGEGLFGQETKYVPRTYMSNIDKMLLNNPVYNEGWQDAKEWRTNKIIEILRDPYNDVKILLCNTPKNMRLTYPMPSVNIAFTRIIYAFWEHFKTRNIF